MKWRAVVLGLAAFLVAMVAVFPARWIGGLLPSTVQCGAWRGTLWRGRCRQLTVVIAGQPPVSVETAGWALHPLPLLRARLSVEVVLTDARGDVSGHVELTRKGEIVARDVSARALLDPGLPTAMPSGWSARIEIHDLGVAWQDYDLRGLQGELRFVDLRDEQGHLLGNYHVDFPAVTAPPFTGQLADDGGPFELQATLELNAGRRWKLQGKVRPRPEADPALVQNLQVLGRADSSGFYPLGAEGSFK